MTRLDDLRRALEAAIGNMTPARAQELARSFLEPGAAKEQVAKTAADILDWSQRNRERLTDVIRHEVADQMKQVGVATQDDLDTVRKRVRELERRAGMTASGRARARRRPPRGSPPRGSRPRRSRRPRSAPPRSRRTDPAAERRTNRGMSRRRLDAELVRRGLAPSRAQAREAVTAGQVRIAGITATKPATLVAEDAPVEVAGSVRPFVSRGGSKLAAALDRFGIDPKGAVVPRRRRLHRGVHGLLAAAGRRPRDRRRRRLRPARLGASIRPARRRHGPHERPHVDAGGAAVRAGARVADLSFISLGSVLPTLAQLGTATCGYVVLVKPQFEAGREAVGRGGVVRDPEVWRRVLVQVGAAAQAAGLAPAGVMASPLPGPAGNVEFLLELRRGRAPTGPLSATDVEAAIAEGEVLRR